jgi:hypothetical protein
VLLKEDCLVLLRKRSGLVIPVLASIYIGRQEI